MKKTVSIGLVLTMGLVTVNLAGEGIWTRKADMPTARRSFAASEVNGKIYVIGGWDVSWDPTPLATVEVYDPATDTWERKADMPTPRGALATAVLDGKIYAIGGAIGHGQFTMRTVEVYDPATDTWEQGIGMSTERWFHSAAVVNGRLYAIGGVSSMTMEEYNPDTQIWTRKANMPTSRWVFGTGVVNGRIYAIGGDIGAIISNVLEYDPISDSWTQKTNMPTARSALGTAVVHDRIYCIGGTKIGPDGPSLPTVEVYNPATDTWETSSDIPTPRSDFTVATTNGKIYAIGGLSDRICSTVEEYTPAITPVFDFNGDETVDGADMCMMIDYWGTDEPLYDIAPPPFGDGIVDVQDLILLSEHLFEEIYPMELLAYWKLDETEGIIAYDIAGSNDSVLFGEPVWQPAEGKRGGALELDGIDDYIKTDFILSPTEGKFSVFAWINGGAPGQVIISQADGIGTGETWLGITASDGNLMTGLMPPQVGRSVIFPLESQSLITDGQWHHIGFVWDGAYRCLYMDGTEVARDTKALTLAPLKHSDGGLYIGTSKTLDAGTFFSGLIDDIRIYNKALSADTIAALAE